MSVEEIESRNETYYKKIGKKYVPFDRFDVEGLSEGLWAIYKNPYSKEYRNLIYPVLTHRIKDAGKFSDFYKKHKDVLNEMVREKFENFLNDKDKSFTRGDLVDCIIAGMAEIDD